MESLSSIMGYDDDNVVVVSHRQQRSQQKQQQQQQQQQQLDQRCYKHSIKRRMTNMISNNTTPIRFISYPTLLILLSLHLFTTTAFTTITTTSSLSPRHTSFLPPTTTNTPPTQNKRSIITTTSSSTSLRMVFSRMSEDCIAALMTAQTESARLDRPSVTPALMTLGIIEHPQNARRTLQSFKITLGDTRSIVADLYPAEEKKNVMESLFQKQAAARNVDLPFSAELKKVLKEAERLSLEMGSEELNSEHVMLALVGEGGEGCCEEMAMVVERWGKVEGGDVLRSRLLSDLQNNPPSSLATTLSSSAATPTLDDIGIDLTAQAATLNLDPIHGRTDIILRTLRTLLRRRKNNPCLIGEPGVGKTAIAEGVAQILAAPSMLENLDTLFTRDANTGDFQNPEEIQRLKDLAALCPPSLRSHRLISLPLGPLIAGTKYRGEFEERLQSILSELSAPDSPPTILFIDEIHTLVGAGTAEGGIDAANALKPALARGEVTVIGATTIGEYREHIESDAALERRLQPVLVCEPSVEETEGVLGVLKARYERHHGVVYEDDAMRAAVRLAERFVSDRFLPDKAIDLMDEAGAMVQQLPGRESVTEEDVRIVVSEWTGIPVQQLTSDETSRLVNLESLLHSSVKGQDAAVTAVSRAVRRGRSGLRDRNRPVASFLFCGPTGVGKTELCKRLSEVYFNGGSSSGSSRMVRLDMSEYMERHTVSRLTGPPPGYIGYEEGGQLTEPIRTSPHSLILLDELEKAHPDVLNILLQILDDGRLTDGKGRVISFKNVILVMTSNVGSQRLLRAASNGNSDINEMRAIVMEELENEMRPELLNRIDDIVAFEPLGDESLESIAVMMMNETMTRALEERGIRIRPSRSLIELVTRVGSASAGVYGARPMRRAVQRYFEDVASEGIIRGFLREDDDDDGEAVLELVDGEVRQVMIVKEKGGECLVVTVDEDGNGGGVGGGGLLRERTVNGGVNGDVNGDVNGSDEDGLAVGAKKQKKRRTRIYEEPYPNGES